MVPYFGNLYPLLFTLVSFDEIVVTNSTTSVYAVSEVIDRDISMAWKTEFSSSHIVLLTYRDIVGYYERGYNQTFQVALASDGATTYVIFNYEDVNFTDVLTGIYLPGVCSIFDFDHKTSSDNMDIGSNVNVPGRYIFRISEHYCPGNFINIVLNILTALF